MSNCELSLHCIKVNKLQVKYKKTNNLINNLEDYLQTVSLNNFNVVDHAKKRESLNNLKIELKNLAYQINDLQLKYNLITCS